MEEVVRSTIYAASLFIVSHRIAVLIAIAIGIAGLTTLVPLADYLEERLRPPTYIWLAWGYLNYEGESTADWFYYVPDRELWHENEWPANANSIALRSPPLTQDMDLYFLAEKEGIDLTLHLLFSELLLPEGFGLQVEPLGRPTLTFNREMEPNQIAPGVLGYPIRIPDSKPAEWESSRTMVVSKTKLP